MKCPFCDDGDFDKVGLKYHLVDSVFPCKAFQDTLTVEEEQALRIVLRSENEQ